MNRKIESPEELTNEHIQQLAKKYQKKFGTEPGCFDLLLKFLDAGYSNHNMAKQMVRYDKNTTAREKWIFLANLYAQLHNNHGPLAHSVCNLFSQAFKVNFLNWKQVAQDTFQEATAQHIADEFEQAIDKHFSRQNISIHEEGFFIDVEKSEKTPLLN